MPLIKLVLMLVIILDGRIWPALTVLAVASITSNTIITSIISTLLRGRASLARVSCRSERRLYECFSLHASSSDLRSCI
jgi:hypothetical protein